MKLLNGLEAVLGVVDIVVNWIVGSALLLMTAVLFFNSVGRAFFGASMVGGPALGRLLAIWLCFLGAYLLVRTNRHVAINIVTSLVSDRVARGLAVVTGIVGAVTMGYVGWLGALFTAKRFAYGQIDPMLDVPIGIFYLPLPIGGFLMSIAFLVVAVKAAIGVDDKSLSEE